MPFGTTFDVAVFQYTCAQKAPHQSQDTFVPHVLAQITHQQIVVDVVEKAFNVNVDHPTALFAHNVMLGASHGIVGISPRPVAVARVTERRI